MAKFQVITLIFAAVVAIQARSFKDERLSQLAKKQTCPVPAGTTSELVDINDGSFVRDATSLLSMDAGGCLTLCDNSDVSEKVCLKFSPATDITEIKFRSYLASGYTVNVYKGNKKFSQSLSANANDEFFSDFSVPMTKSGVTKIEIIPDFVSGEVEMKKIQICN